jgi:4-amino-4-deoxy-L-arabinose transferase-like glycosyltransferase
VEEGMTKAGFGTGSWMQRYPRIILISVTLACLLPFANKAIHIDDPLFVWAGRHMQTEWWDPYGFDVNWYGSVMPMHEVTKNPPLACAYLALIIRALGENEIALHLAFLAQAIAVVLGTYALARRLSSHPFQAALAALFTPVFMVSSTTLMCDMLMLAFWVWAVVLWMRGLEDNEPLTLVLADLLVSACALAKYLGIALIPLLLAYSLWRNRKAGGWLVYLLIPVVVMGLYEWGTRAFYGHGLLLDAFRYANQNEAHIPGGFLVKTLTAASFTGGCCAIALILAPLLWRTIPWVRVGIAAAALVVTICVLDAQRFGITFQYGLCVLGGLIVLTLAVLDLKQHKNAESLLLALWVLGIFAFSIFNWTINGRSILPMVPAVAILLFRRIEAVNEAKTPRLHWFLGVAAALSLFVAWADYQLANSARAAAIRIKNEFGGSPANAIWFQGHWGFQYYAETNGFLAFDSAHQLAHPGDLIVLPFNNTNLVSIPKETVERVTTIELPASCVDATMRRPFVAGFYMDILGPLPFAFGPVPAEKYYVLRFK